MSNESNENEINLEDQYKNMVQSNESQETQEEPVNLGRVNMDRFNGEKAESADFHLGYHVIPTLSLPSGGMFYPDGTEISIRSAKVAEIRHFSTIDETNVLDIDEKLNQILESCLIKIFLKRIDFTLFYQLEI
jgi:diadenosine tetraphosphate (Ap4A) HIT family hydrolase